MRNSFIFILENAFKNVVCDMASIGVGLNELTLFLLYWPIHVIEALTSVDKCAR